MPVTSKSRIIAYLDKECYEAFQAYAGRQHRSVSAQIGYLIDQALQAEKAQRASD